MCLALAYVLDRPLNEGIIQKDNACYVGGLHMKRSTRRYILIGKEAVLKTAAGNCLGVRSSLPPLKFGLQLNWQSVYIKKITIRRKAKIVPILLKGNTRWRSSRPGRLNKLSDDNEVIDETDLSNIVILFRNEWNQTTEKIEL